MIDLAAFWFEKLLWQPEHTCACQSTLFARALEGLTLCLRGQVSIHCYVSVHLVHGTEFIGTAHDVGLAISLSLGAVPRTGSATGKAFLPMGFILS